MSKKLGRQSKLAEPVFQAIQVGRWVAPKTALSGARLLAIIQRRTQGTPGRLIAVRQVVGGEGALACESGGQHPCTPAHDHGRSGDLGRQLIADEPENQAQRHEGAGQPVDQGEGVTRHIAPQPPDPRQKTPGSGLPNYELVCYCGAQR